MTLKKTAFKAAGVRIAYCPGWRNKPCPWWFRANYPSGGGTVQAMGLEVWW